LVGLIGLAKAGVAVARAVARSAVLDMVVILLISGYQKPFV